jgi:hypothetical protein
MERWLVDQKHKAEAFCKFIHAELEEGRPRFYTIVHANRTNKQNNSLHLLFRQLAEGLNDAGFEIEHPFNPKFKLAYTENDIKKFFFMPIIKQAYEKDHTSDLTTKELSDACSAMIDSINQATGVYVPYPSMEP